MRPRVAVPSTLFRLRSGLRLVRSMVFVCSFAFLSTLRRQPHGGVELHGLHRLYGPCEYDCW